MHYQDTWADTKLISTFIFSMTRQMGRIIYKKLPNFAKYKKNRKQKILAPSKPLIEYTPHKNYRVSIYDCKELITPESDGNQCSRWTIKSAQQFFYNNWDVYD